MNKALTKQPNKAKRLELNGRFKIQVLYYLMAIVPILWVFIFHYLPISGLYMAFTDYKANKGVFGGKWVGLKWFKMFIESYDFRLVVKNTLLYTIAKIILVDIGCGMLFALLLYEIRSRIGNKIFHTCMLLPAFLSWTVVSASFMLFMQPDSGFITKILTELGLERINFYREAKWWPYILLLAMMYKDAGMSSIYFYSALLSIDSELFSASKLDGANRLQQIRHISLPATKKIFCITLITSLGHIFSGSLQPYYNMILGSESIRSTTLTLGLYLQQGVAGGRFGYTAAVGLMQSVIGTIMVITTNTIVKKLDDESSLF